jgi:hypothetical protein
MIIYNTNFSGGSVWVQNFNIKGGTETEGAEEDIWTEEG